MNRRMLLAAMVGLSSILAIAPAALAQEPAPPLSLMDEWGLTLLIVGIVLLLGGGLAFVLLRSKKSGPADGNAHWPPAPHDSGSTTIRRKALTLLELIVVLVILVATAGIVIPLLPNIAGPAHSAVGATNTSEVNRIIQVYQTTYDAYPNYLDNLAGTGTAPIDYLPGYLAGGTSVGQITVGNLTAAQLAALNNAGLTQVATLYATKASLPANNTPPASPTFNPYLYTTTPPITPLTTSLQVAFLSEAAVEGPNGIVKDDPTLTGDIYVVFGFGKQTTAIGRVVSDAPVKFGETAPDQATNVYCRYGLVFRVARGNGTATPTQLTQAIFVGSVSFEDTGIMGTDGQLANYYDTIKKQQ